MRRLLTVILLFLLVPCAYSKDVVDNKGRNYRNPKLSLFDNTVRSRNMLGVLAVTQGISSRLEPQTLFKIRESSHYQERISDAPQILDYKILNNSLNILNQEKNILDIKNSNKP
ncbi:hypothetical protein [Campylobacter sp. RM16188]|uniref:hypothetical protein n=1 Tax=Campylobacter sp. RM16188 TaxID=1705725 RepID=UPI001552E9FA|nr:hypothetical protein [Campylobacter sp. RM16188]